MTRKCLLVTIILIVAFSQGARTQNFSITIDAEKDTWYDGLTGPENGLVFMPAECYLRDIGTTPPDNDADLSAMVWMAHDSAYLYLYAEVKDDIVNGSNGARYLNDCLELKFDPEPSEGGSYTIGLNTRLTVLGEGGGGFDNLSGLPYFTPEAGADYARRITGDGYALEFRLPIESLETSDGRSLSFNETGKMGLAINIGDNDSGTRDNMLQWSAGHSDAAHGDPKLLGTVTFLENNKLGFDAVSIMDPSIVNTNAADWYSNPDPTGIDSKLSLAESFKMLSNYPNPFNPETKIQYQIKNAETATLAIYSSTGELIRNLAVDQFHAPGSYEITWNGQNQLGVKVSSGIYIYRLSTESQIVSNKMMLMK